MRDLVKWLGISLGLHLAGISCLPFLAAMQEKNVYPIVIDLTLAAFPAAVKQQAVTKGETAALSLPVVRASREQQREKEPIDKLKQPASPQAEQSMPQIQPVEPKNVAETGEEGSSTSRRTAGGDMGGRVPSPAVPTGGAGKTPDRNERQRYLAEHFSYIRDLVRKHLVYPTVARRMGWGGKAVVAFIVMEDGTASNIRLVESTGFPLLDRSALETIRRAAPFPKPPVRAEIVLPVLFKLL